MRVERPGRVVEDPASPGNGLPGWIFALRDRVPGILAGYRAGSPGLYRLCREGDVVRPGPAAGLGFSCLAAKTAVQCGLWDAISTEHKQAWIRHIQGFQLPPGPPGYGMFRDPAIERRGYWRYVRSCVRHGHFRDLMGPIWRNRWAETRQAMATLFAVGSAPTCKVGGFPLDPEKIKRFLDNLDWRHPWGAGAQAGHLLFFLRHGDGDERARLAGKDAVLNFFGGIESPVTGGWYRGQVSNQEIINGAMKVLSGLYWWDEPARRAEVLAETAAWEPDDAHDCALVNRMFVLHRLSAQHGRVPDGAVEIVRASLDAMPAFIQADGGFSASKSGSLPYYYYTKVSDGRPVGDLHGLALFTWGITLGAHLLGKERSLGWRLVAP